MTKRKLAAGALMFCMVGAGCSAGSSSPRDGTPTPPLSAEISYGRYRDVLLEFVDARGQVDYGSLQANRGELDEFMAELGSLDPAAFEGWSDDDKIALWINAYNALTLKAIIDHYPIEASIWRSVLFPKNSIRQIPGVWTELEFEIMGSNLTLDRIEHEKLREGFHEPRIHMALVCAAMSCPPLRWEPYTGESLDTQLEDQTVRFLGSPGRFRIDREKGRVELSSIFKWFADDFVAVYEPASGFEGRKAGERSVLNFIALHLEGPDKEFLRAGDYEATYVDYDWSLNETSGSEP